MTLRHWFRLDAAYVARREAALEAQENAAIRSALDTANKAERAFGEELLRVREANRIVRRPSHRR